jgi:hypothetical protein
LELVLRGASAEYDERTRGRLPTLQAIPMNRSLYAAIEKTTLRLEQKLHAKELDRKASKVAQM